MTTKPKAPKKPTLLQEITQDVQRRADTAGTAINAAEVSRVIKLTFDALSDLDASRAMFLLLNERKKRTKAPSPAAK